MNHFMARLIFCFFAEHTDIFNGRGLFTDTIEQMSETNGSNAHQVMEAIFCSMNIKAADRAASGLPGQLSPLRGRQRQHQPVRLMPKLRDAVFWKAAVCCFAIFEQSDHLLKRTHEARGPLLPDGDLTRHSPILSWDTGL
ncbi:type IIL restriction-modification enzyme MmeI [Acidicapsa ligni]|uniref:type IIL restriction-modification enzyme MmeI n=1 Tax=Acidicapsa ligni TaxID=542300 RepID=UPI00295A7E4F|nr:type IIL restriction-modification enzyme MmeI [Acidicapsa ligni]